MNKKKKKVLHSVKDFLKMFALRMTIVEIFALNGEGLLS